MRKKLLAAMIACSMIISCMTALTANAETKKINPSAAFTETQSSTDSYGDYEYFVDDDGAAVITGYKGSGTSLSVPSSIQGKKVKSIGYDTFREHTELTEVTVPDTVSYIGEFAFYGCSNLKKVELPTSVTEVDYGAFDNTPWLEDSDDEFFISGNGVLIKYNGKSDKLEIPSKVTSIAGGALESCDLLTSVVIPNTVISIGSYAFSGCYNMKTVNIPNSVQSIGYYAFFDCGSLTDISVPNSVTAIGECAFQNCTGLKSITLPNSLKEISGCTFESCTSLKNITIPDSVIKIGWSAFRKCISLDTINISKNIETIEESAFEGTPWLKNYSNDFVTIGNGVLYQYKGTATDITLPNNVKSISDSAFSYNSKITSVIFPDSLTEIASKSFSGCKGLKSVTIGNSVKYIGFETFKDCTNLSDVKFGNSVNYISDEAFKNCTSLKRVDIPDSVDNICFGAFSGCSNLESVYITDFYINIDDLVFENCPKLTIYGYKDSMAESYASAKNIKFVEIKTPTVTPPDKPIETPIKTYKYGDLDDDGAITSADSLLILRASVKLENFNEVQTKLADVDSDGNISSADALEVLRYSVKLPTTGKTGETMK